MKKIYYPLIYVSFIISLCLTSIIGCTTDLTGDDYNASEARTIQTVNYGVVREVKPVRLTANSNSLIGGPLAGAGAGAIAGSTVGHGAGNKLAYLAGGVLGYIAGGAIEKKISNKAGVEITVTLDNGKIVSVVQQRDPHIHFLAGERVKILSQGTTSRVVKE